MQAIDAMKNALDTFQIEGVRHNMSLLRSVMNNGRFMSGDMHTNFLQEEYPNGFKAELEDQELKYLLCISTLLSYEDAARKYTEEQNESFAFQPAEYLILTFQGKEYKGTLNASENIVKLEGEGIDPISLDVNY